jgi:hypothetical protein
MTPELAEIIRDTDCRLEWTDYHKAAEVLADQFTKSLCDPNNGLVWGEVTFGERAEPIVTVDCGREYFQQTMEIVFAHLRRSRLGAVVHFDRRYIGFMRGCRLDSTSFPAACQAFAAARPVPEEEENISDHIVWARTDLVGPITYCLPHNLPDAPPPRLGRPIGRTDQPAEPTPPEPRSRSIYLD